MPLRLKLALWYGGLTGLVVVLICLYSYAIHSRTHYDEFDRKLEGSAEHVAAELAAAAPSDYRAILSASLLLGTGIRIFDPAGNIVHQSANAAPAPSFASRMAAGNVPRTPYGSLAALAPSLHRVDPGTGRFDLVTGRDGKRWRIYELTLGGGRGVLAAVEPLDYLDASIEGFARLMLLMVMLGTMFAFLVGWFLSSRALRPVAVLTDTARSIARSPQFSRRVPAGTGRDELGQLAGTFNEMLASLERAYSAQERFVSDASHEFRIPLTVISANLELLRHATVLSVEERRRAVRDAYSEAARLTRLVTDLLVLARADAGQTVRLDPVELDRVLMDVVGKARNLTQGQHLEITTLEPLAMTGDADRLQQLFCILVENAIKYTPPPGRIWIALRRTGSSAEVTIRDSGIGIPDQAIAHVFERFYRADRARSHDPGGTGLGLSIAQWIVTRHGGTVQLANAPDRGVIATVRLPLPG